MLLQADPPVLQKRRYGKISCHNMMTSLLLKQISLSLMAPQDVAGRKQSILLPFCLSASKSRSRAKQKPYNTKQCKISQTLCCYAVLSCCTPFGAGGALPSNAFEASFCIVAKPVLAVCGLGGSGTGGTGGVPGTAVPPASGDDAMQWATSSAPTFSKAFAATVFAVVFASMEKAVHPACESPWQSLPPHHTHGSGEPCALEPVLRLLKQPTLSVIELQPSFATERQWVKVGFRSASPAGFA